MLDLSRYSAAIFYQDGVLIDSEPLWQDAEIAACTPYAVPLARELCHATAGRRIDEVPALRDERIEWRGLPVEARVERVLAGVTGLIMDRGRAPGHSEDHVDDAPAMGRGFQSSRACTCRNCCFNSGRGLA